MNKQISVNQTINENLGLWNNDTNSQVSDATFSNTVSTVSPEGILSISPRENGVDVFGIAPGQATLHIETDVHFTIDGGEYNKRKGVDVVFDCTGTENTSLILNP